MAYYKNSIHANFEAILYANGRIQFKYGLNTGQISATVGISNGQGLFIAEDAMNLNYIDSIVFTPSDLITNLDQGTWVKVPMVMPSVVR